MSEQEKNKCDVCGREIDLQNMEVYERRSYRGFEMLICKKCKEIEAESGIPAYDRLLDEILAMPGYVTLQLSKSHFLALMTAAKVGYVVTRSSMPDSDLSETRTALKKISQQVPEPFRAMIDPDDTGEEGGDA